MDVPLVDHNETGIAPIDNGTFLRFSPTSASTSAAASSPGRPGNVYVYVWLFLGLLVFLLTLLIISLHRLKNIISSSSSVPDCSSEGGSSFTNMEICSISSQRSTISSLSTWGWERDGRELVCTCAFTPACVLTCKQQAGEHMLLPSVTYKHKNTTPAPKELTERLYSPCMHILFPPVLWVKQIAKAQGKCGSPCDEEVLRGECDWTLLSLISMMKTNEPGRMNSFFCKSHFLYCTCHIYCIVFQWHFVQHASLHLQKKISINIIFKIITLYRNACFWLSCTVRLQTLYRQIFF